MTMTAMTAPSVNNLTYPYIHPLHVLNLARETDVSVLVPSALYFLSVYPLSEILAGDHPKLTVTHPSRPSSELRPADLQSYTLMHQYRLQIGLDFIRRTCTKWSASSSSSPPPNPSCTTPGECSKTFSRLTSRLQRSWNPKSAAIFFMLQVSHEAMSTAHICGTCRKDFAEEVEELRLKSWDALPGIVGLPPWTELVNRDLSTEA